VFAIVTATLASFEWTASAFEKRRRSVSVTPNASGSPVGVTDNAKAEAPQTRFSFRNFQQGPTGNNAQLFKVSDPIPRRFSTTRLSKGTTKSTPS
jgi:hypothetical protein